MEQRGDGQRVIVREGNVKSGKGTDERRKTGKRDIREGMRIKQKRKGRATQNTER